MLVFQTVKHFFHLRKTHQSVGRIPGRLRDFLNRLMCTLAVRDTQWVGWSPKGDVFRAPVEIGASDQCG